MNIFEGAIFHASLSDIEMYSTTQTHMYNIDEIALFNFVYLAVILLRRWRRIRRNTGNMGATL